MDVKIKYVAKHCALTHFANTYTQCFINIQNFSYT